jgi:prephenate dehydrogenase
MKIGFEKKARDTEVCIVGLGLIGGSFAKALKKLPFKKITSCHNEEGTIRRAIAQGVIDEGSDDPSCVLPSADFVILCLYPGDTLEFLRKSASMLKKGSLLTDTASVKGQYGIEASLLLPESVRFVMGHPMAGKEGSGFDMSDGDIFHGASYILLPTKKSERGDIDFIKDMAEAIGCSRLIETDSATHDRMVAYTSALPHAAAAALINTQKAAPEDIAPFIGGSFRDASRVADINVDLWTELFKMNGKNIIEELGRFIAELEKIKTAVERNDPLSLKNVFIAAADRRKTLLK